MPSDLHIRDERPADCAAISGLITRAFVTAPHSNGAEQFIVTALRNADALAVSLVAEQAGELLGYIAFSPVSVTDSAPGWYGLGPVAVEPQVQGTGTGSALVLAGLGRLRKIGASGSLPSPACSTRGLRRSTSWCRLSESRPLGAMSHTMPRFPSKHSELA